MKWKIKITYPDLEKTFLDVLTVNSGKTLDNDGTTTEVTGLKSGMLSATSLAVVLITNGDPLDALGLVVAGNVRHTAPLSGQLVLNFVGFIVFRVNGSAEGNNVISTIKRKRANRRLTR